MGYCPVLLYIFNAIQLSKSLIYMPRHGEKLTKFTAFESFSWVTFNIT